MQYDRVQRTLALILILNLIVATAKGVFGLIAGSVSMVADAIHSAFDTVSNIIGIAAIYIAKQPPDQLHPYGHGKFETIGALLIGALLMLSAYWIITEGIDRLTSASVPEITGLTVAVLIVTIIINIFVAWYERRVGTELRSQILLADSRHTMSDIFVSCSVLAGFVVITIGYPQADPIIAFGISVLIAKMGIDIIREASNVLTDAIVIDCEKEIATIVQTTKGVWGYHEFRCRGKPQEMFADIHILVDPGITVAEGHDIADLVKERILNEIQGMADVVVHIDPAGDEEKN